MDSSPRVPGLPEIRDEELTDSAPAVRALLVHRLEQIWRVVEPHVDGTRSGEDGWGPDVRMIEAGIRVLDRIAKVYRLEHPVSASPGTGEVAGDVRALVARQLGELEERTREG